MVSETRFSTYIERLVWCLYEGSFDMNERNSTVLLPSRALKYNMIALESNEPATLIGHCW